MSAVLHSMTGLLVTVGIPFVAIVGGISFAAYSLYLRVHRQRELMQMYHAERMAAIEKGIELPPLPPELLHSGYDFGGVLPGYRRWRRGRGVRLIFVGAAVTIALWQTNGDKSFWWGLVIVAWGLGQLVSEALIPAAPPPSSATNAMPSGPDLPH